MSLKLKQSATFNITMVPLIFLALFCFGDVTCSRRNLRVSQRLVMPDVTPGNKGTFSQHIWDQTNDIRQNALTAKIIRGITSGKLDPVDFGVYMLQDGVWCEKVGDAMKLMAQKVGVSNDIHLYSFLLQKGNDYHRYAREIYDAWHITDPTAIKESGACQAYHEYELHVAQTMNVSSFIACMIPCEKLWPWIGQQINPNGTNSFGPYTEWVQNSFDPTYDHYNVLDNLLDEMHARGEVDEQEVLEVYRNSMIAEVDFFSDP